MRGVPERRRGGGAGRVRRRAVVRGRVQGVGFRWAAAAEAERLGIAGWVRNRFDGAVEAELEGEAAVTDLMLDWLRHGPPTAAVDGVEVVELEPTDEPGFRIRS